MCIHMYMVCVQRHFCCHSSMLVAALGALGEWLGGWLYREGLWVCVAESCTHVVKFSQCLVTQGGRLVKLSSSCLAAGHPTL